MDDNTPEKVALDLLKTIAHIEKRTLHSGPPDGWMAADRSWLLRTYAECIAAVRAGTPVAAVASAYRRPIE